MPMIAAMTAAALLQTGPDLRAVADYRADATMYVNGETQPIEVRASAPLMRMTLPPSVAGEPYQTVMTWNLETREAALFPVGRNVPAAARVVYQMPVGQAPAANIGFDHPASGQAGAPVGIAGETCRDHVQQTQNAYGEIVRVAACFTDDGILLRQTINGQVEYEVTMVERSLQPDILFQPPEGYRRQSIGNAQQGEDGHMAGVLGEALERYSEEARDEADRRTRSEVQERTRGALDRLFGD